MHNSISPAVRSDDSNRSLSRHTHPTGFLNLFPTGCSCNLDPNKPLKTHEPEPFQPAKPPHPTHQTTLSTLLQFVGRETTGITRFAPLKTFRSRPDGRSTLKPCRACENRGFGHASLGLRENTRERISIDRQSFASSASPDDRTERTTTRGRERRKETGAVAEERARERASERREPLLLSSPRRGL